MPIAVRTLEPGEESAVEAFLALRPNSTIFLRSNLLRAGLGDRDSGRPFTGTWAGAFDGRRLVGVAALFWNGNVILSAERHAGFLARTLAELRPGDTIQGILGPHDEVVDARRALNLDDAPTSLVSREILYALAIEHLQLPEPLRTGEVVVRAPTDDEMPRLEDWRMDYVMEALRMPDTPEARADQRAYLDRYQRDGHHFVAVRDGELVSYSAFNATLPDVVQVGGVWTPPPLRARGYARSVVAGSLQIARDRGITRAVLFTDEQNPAAQASYAAIGFRRVGDYGIILFAAPPDAAAR